MTREEAIKTLRELWRETNDTWYEEVYNMAIEALSADAVQGEWIHDGQNFKGGLDWCHCSECGHKTSTNGLSVYRFCPNCGAIMKGGAE